MATDALAVLRDQYGREIEPILAYMDDIEAGDILFATGNGANSRPNIIRVLQSPRKPRGQRYRLSEIEVVTIYPACSVCKEECRHPHIMPYGSLLKTRLLIGNLDNGY